MDRQQVNLLLWVGRNELSALNFYGASATGAWTLQTDRLDAVQQPALSLSFSSHNVLGFLEAPHESSAVCVAHDHGLHFLFVLEPKILRPDGCVHAS